jgi:hypothetical protein
MSDIVLSTGKKCPRCGCDSLEIYYTTKRFMAYYFQTFFHCVAECGMDFGLSRMAKGKMKIGFDEVNRPYLEKRFNFKVED